MASLFFDNRRLLVLVIALIVVAGLSSFYALPHREDPALNKRMAVVNTVYPGAKPDRVESLVTERIEEELQEIPEIKELRSVSRLGISSITIELSDNVYEVDEVWSRVRDKISDARPLLPAGAGESEFDELELTAYASLVALVWNLPGEPNYAILRRRVEELEQRLRSIRGTLDVDTFGDPQEEIVVDIRPSDLSSRGIRIEEVADQIEASDAKVSAGLLRTPRANLLLEVDSELDSISRISATPIQHGEDGRFTLLGDVAEVRKGIEDPKATLAIVDGNPAIALGVLVQTNIRIDQWAAAADSALTRFAADLPPGIRLKVIFEQNRYVAARLHVLLGNLLVGAGAIMLVIWFMMGWRSAILVGSALPLASLMVLAVMGALRLPIHQMSVTGLIIALGLLIDNAIVIVDEVQEKLRRGVERRAAVATSVRHLAVPLCGSTLTTALSFAPIALMPGPAGEFVGSVAISVILAVFSSFLLAMSVTPAVAAILLPVGKLRQRRRWWAEGFSLPLLTSAYRTTLTSLFRHPVSCLLLAGVLPAIGFFLATGLTEQFFPPADRDQFHVQIELPAHTPIDATQKLVGHAEDLMLRHDRVDDVSWFLGESAPPFYYNMMVNRHGVPQFAQAIVQIDSAEGVREIIRELQRQLDAEFPMARVLVRQLEQGPPFEAPIEIRLFGPDLGILRRLGAEVRRLLSETPDVLHSVSELSESLPKLALRVDEAEARLAGLDHEAIARQLDTALEGSVGGSVLEATEELPVRVRIASERRANLTDVGSLNLVPTELPVFDGEGPISHAPYLPLSALAIVALTPEIATIEHLNTERMNEVRGYITAGVLPAEVLTAFQARMAESGLEMPAGYRLEYGGETSKRNAAVGNLMSSAGVLLVLMVATLVLSFRSFRAAALIFGVAVLSIGLGLGAVAVFGYPFGFIVIVGTMGLVGVAINDSIVVLAAIRENEEARAGDPEALADVIVRASRHVIATTLTTIAGFLPLLLGGGQFWPPLAATIAGGVAGATLLAIGFIPAGYLLLMCRGDNPQRETTDSASIWNEAVVFASQRVPELSASTVTYARIRNKRHREKS